MSWLRDRVVGLVQRHIPPQYEILPITDRRVVALHAYGAAAYGGGCTDVNVTILRGDWWAWINGRTAEGKRFSLDVRGAPGCASAALAGALRVIADSRTAAVPDAGRTAAV